MTVESVLEFVRALVADDDDTSQTWTDAQYTVFLNEGMRFIFDRYPDSRVAATGMSVSVWADANDGTPQAVLCINDVYQNALVTYVAYRYYTRDSGDSRDTTRATNAYKHFQELLSPRE